MITPLGDDLWHCENIEDIDEFQRSRPFDRVVYGAVPFMPMLWLWVWWDRLRGIPLQKPDYRRGYLVTFEED